MTLLAATSLGSAELVEVTLTLEPARTGINTVNLALAVLVVGNDNDDTRVSGSITAQIDIDPTSGRISSLAIASGNLSATPVEFASAILVGAYDLETDVLGGTIVTTNPPAPVAANGQSPAERHTFAINSGRLFGTSRALTTTSIVNESFVTNPLMGQGSAGTFVTITAVPNAASTPTNASFDILLSYPLALTQAMDVQGVSATITANGTLRATGTASVPLATTDPYAEWVASNNLGGVSFSEFTASALLPNGLLWALGYQADEVPAVLTATDTDNGLQFRLALPATGTVGEVLLESSATLSEPWTPVPASALSTAQNPIPVGTSGEILVTPDGSEVLFYRLRADDPGAETPPSE